MFTKNIFNQIKFETKFHNFSELNKTKHSTIFDQKILIFFDKLSEKIFKRKDLNKYPDLASYAFFCRKKNILRLKKNYSGFEENRYGRGISLHFTPSNVPMNFAYSLFFGLISGNSCIIRLSNIENHQSKILINELNNLLQKKKFFFLKKKIIILRYKKNKNITDVLSSICDVRLIWGGDETIYEIRKSPLSANAFDVTFADKYSISIIGCDGYLKSPLKRREAVSFFNDTLFFDQNACTSPKIIFWIGNKDKVNKARKVFWKYFENTVNSKNYNPRGNSGYEKFYKETLLTLEQDITINKGNQNIKKILLKKIPKNLEKYFSPGGVFIEFQSKNLKKLKKIINNKIQTITYINFNPTKIVDDLDIKRIKAVDRIVMNGRSSEIGLEWDGYDIIFQISKKLVII